jgi:hypothetical protein
MGQTIMHLRIIALVLLVLFSASAMTFGDDLANYKKFREYVKDGKLVAGEKEFDGLLQKTPQDNSIRVPLGVLQFLRAIEGLGQDYYLRTMGGRACSPVRRNGLSSIGNL